MLYKLLLYLLYLLIDKLVCDNESFNETEKIDRIGALLSIISYLTDSLVKKNQMIMDNAIKANVLDSTFIIKTMDYINSNYYICTSWFFSLF